MIFATVMSNFYSRPKIIYVSQNHLSISDVVLSLGARHNRVCGCPLSANGRQALEKEVHYVVCMSCLSWCLLTNHYDGEMHVYLLALSYRLADLGVVLIL